MSDPVLEASSLPVNSIGEVIIRKGTGNSTISGQLQCGMFPVSPSGELLFVDTKPTGAWAYMQDGRYTSSSPLTITSGTKHKVDFDLSNLSYVDGRGGLQILYNELSDKFLPETEGDCFLVSFRYKAVPVSQNGSCDIEVECPTVSFNPIVADTVTFNKSAGNEHFFSITQPIFISSFVVDHGLELYMTPRGTNISVYDYSILVIRTYVQPT